ncbi:uncharacterized protein Z519_08428 [Cladophialophora bantiana CBS 173.52]|uniref:Heterokaryon incompatibility domain-containing protein n=1 Tax=Cladophialophora bantiana (strain ATCC 10958 / CBS 173.52 / CDC B-1940 / NIH 8579) TaxID=1442370 RepID=A0A0D2HIR7_CLAB1|nr:uncharacterized protein Z519_08428 [Cladophialophora bantiana CBS 173.52]KIW90645.1 hypothetical protein Z519_08428 [Cladophialophora bantiana CBS 173.52]
MAPLTRSMTTSASEVDSTPSPTVENAGLSSENATGSLKDSLYLPLDENEQEIRLLTLHAGADDTPIELSLEYTSLSNADSFIALSYCWGPPDDGSEVILDGQVIRVRRNLWQFLQNFWSVKGPSRLWVDYLCIDQSNVKERNHQVKLMKDIFSTAASVYAWLGEADPDTDYAITYMNLALSIPRQRRSKSIPREVGRRGTKALGSLIKRDYWTRVWIIPEIVLAQKVFLMISDRVIDWEDLQDVTTRRLTPLIRRTRKNTASRENFRNIWELKRKHNAVWNLYELLGRFHQADCHDPRDRLYGLLGLTSASVRSEVIVDYTSSIMEVCAANMEVICGRFPSKGESGLYARNVEVVVRWILGSKPGSLQTFYNRSIPSQVKTPIVMEVILEARPVSLHTVAAFNSEEDRYVEMTSATERLSFHSYLTRCQANEYKDQIICSTTHWRDWDFILMLGPSAILPVRKTAESYTVMEIGGSSTTDRFSSTSYGICPTDWRIGRIPDVQCTVLEEPVGGWCRVQLNPAAFVEWMRICNFKKGWRMSDIMKPSS